MSAKSRELLFRRALCVLLASTTVALGLISGTVPAVAQETEAPPANTPPEDPSSVPPPPDAPDSAQDPGAVESDEEEVDPGYTDIDVGDRPAQVLDDLEEAPELRDESASFYGAPGEGVHVAAIYSGAINYLGDDGAYHDIDPTLVETEGGYRNAANAFSVTFPDALSESRPVTVEYPEGTMATTHVGANSGPGTVDGASISYSGAYPVTDVTLSVTDSGYKELVTLKDPEASGRFVYRVHTEGLSLVPGPENTIEIVAKGQSLGMLPAPWAEDSNINQDSGLGVVTADVTRDLVDLGGGDYEITLELSHEWLDAPERVFPVVIDPDVTAPDRKDTFVVLGENWSHGAMDELHVGSWNSTDGQKAGSYLRFNISAIPDEATVDEASFKIFNFASQQSIPQWVDLYRVTEDWEETMTFSQRADVDPVVVQSHEGCGHNRRFDNPVCIGWHTYEITDLVQLWADTAVNNKGLALVARATGTPPTTANTWKRYHSREYSDTSLHPVLLAEINAPPPPPNYPGSAPGSEGEEVTYIETDSPTLRVNALGSDPDGDQVFVRFQVSKSKTEWTDPNLVHESPWLEPVNNYVVPSGILEDGKKYYWRAQTTDCYPTCDDAAERTAEGVRQFTITLKKHGSDPRWAMWSQMLGNGVSLKVNEANGNLYLSYPLDSLATPAGPLDIGVSYNSQAAAGPLPDGDFGLSKGWQAYAGPGADARDLPVRLKKLYQGSSFDDPYAVRVTYRSGRHEVYPHIDGRIFGILGSGSTVRRNGDDKGWTLVTPTGSTYTFTSNTDDTTARLDKARVSTTTPTKPGFEYVFAGVLLDRVKDPLGREVDFAYYPDNHLQSITTWDQRSWSFTYNSDGRLASITDPETDTVSFGYQTTASDSPLDEVRDGLSKLTEISYQTLGGFNKPMVTQIALPGVATPWTFAYPGVISGSLSSQTRVTDPRGVPASGTDPVARDYMTVVDFNTQGLPVQIAGPYFRHFEKVAGAYVESNIDDDATWPTVRQFFNGDGDLLCRRGPAAVAKDLKTADTSDDKCRSAATATTNDAVAPKDQNGNRVAKGDTLQSEYEYFKEEPHRLKHTIAPAADSQADRKRLLTAYDYDQGFSGLEASYYANPQLSGLADAVELTDGDLNYSWGQGGPPQLPVDQFSVRYTGEIKAPHGTPESKLYYFKVTAGDNARLVVGTKLIVNCWNYDRFGAAPNCGQDDHSAPKNLGDGWHRFALDYQALTGAASVKVEWRPDDGDGVIEPGEAWQVVPAANLRPSVGVVTSQKSGTRVGTGTVTDNANAFSTTDFEYTSDRDKLAGLASKQTLSGPQPMVSMPISFTYDDYGRTRKETDASGAFIEHFYGVTGDQPCETQTIDRDGLKTTRVCNGAGDVTETNVVVATSDIRTTSTTYDGVGRVKAINYPDGGRTEHDYDDAGWLRETRVKINSDPEWRTTTYTHYPLGWTETETLSDPDGTGPLGRPLVTHFYDEVGNEKRVVDAREKPWVKDHDAANHLTATTDPLLNTWSTHYDVAGNPVRDKDPATVETTRSFDNLDRVTEEQLAGLVPTKMAYDPRGLVTKTTDPDGHFSETSYDAAGRAVEERAPVQQQEGADAVRARTMHYDEFGDMDSQTSFRGKTTTYGYSAMHHLKMVVLPHDPGDTESKATYVLNAAGEVTSVDITNFADVAAVSWDYDYDPMGRVETATDGTDKTTTYHYDLAGQLFRVNDPRGHSVFTEFDGLGRRIERHAEKPLGTLVADSTETYEYDAAGNMTNASNSARNVNVTYDVAGRVDCVDAALDCTNDPGADECNQGNPACTDYDYDGARLASRTDAAGTTVFAYEPTTGRVASVDDPFSSQATLYEYYDSGRPLTRTDANGLFHSYEFDDAGRFEDETVTRSSFQLAHFAQSYDFDSNVTSRTQHVEGSSKTGNWAYQFDAAGRLKSATAPNNSETTYGYDSAGNRTTVTSGQSTVTTTYDAAGRAVSATDGTTYNHDAAGNLTAIVDPDKPDWNYDYDVFSRMTQASSTIDNDLLPIYFGYDHDALDRTTSKTTEVLVDGVIEDVGDIVYHYVGTSHDVAREKFSLVPELPVDRDRLPLPLPEPDVELTQVNYAYGADGAALAQRETILDSRILDLGTVTIERVRRFGMNPHGDLSYVTNSSGQLVASKAYDPWGAVESEKEPTEDIGERDTLFGFQGDPTDVDTELVDMEARLYAPGMGRFTTADSFIGEFTQPLTLNRYIYGGANPTTMIDPDGFRYTACTSICRGNEQKEAEHEAIQVYTGEVQEQAIIIAFANAIYESIAREKGIQRGTQLGINVSADIFSALHEVGTDPRYSEQLLRMGSSGRLLRYIGRHEVTGFLGRRALRPVGAVIELADAIVEGKSVPRVAAKVGGGWAGGWAGAKALGAACPVKHHPYAMAACLIVGGVIGAWMGEGAVNAVLNVWTEPLMSSPIIDTSVPGNRIYCGTETEQSLVYQYNYQGMCAPLT